MQRVKVTLGQARLGMTPSVALIFLASRFRAAIERCDKMALPISFHQFSNGSCGDATLLLGTFLKEQGAGNSTYVLGKRKDHNGDWHSHAWVECNGFIVDITASQFREVTDSVIVTRNSVWHQTFEQERKGAADFRIYDDHTVAALGRAYRTIIRNLVEPP